ncbi:MAG: polysaccharide biosynthesis protein, partial [Thermoleophilia bacterium]|nr:polysaccharide biosynthesis protein [Thermoleophilia bacterium]
LMAHARGGGPIEMLLAAAAGAAVGGVIGYLSLLVRREGMRSWAEHAAEVVRLRNVLTYGGQLFLVLLLMMVFGQLDQFVIKGFHGDAAVAPYALVIKLQAMLIAPAITITSIVAPRIAGAGAAGAAAYRQWLAFFVIVQLGLCGMVGVVAPDLFAAINPDYRNDWGILLAMLPFLLLSGLATLPSVTMNQLGRARARQRIAIIAVLLNVVLDFSLVPSLNAYGAAIGTTVAYAWYVFAHHRLVERALLEQAVVRPPSLTPVLVRGLGLGAAAVVVGLALRPFAETLADGRAGSLLVILIAGVVPGLVYLALVVRLLRRGAPLTRPGSVDA